MSFKKSTVPENLEHETVEEILVYFATSMIKLNTIEEVLWDLAKNCISRLGFVDCVIYIADHDKKTLLQKAAYGPKNPVDFEVAKPIDIPFGEGITGHVIQTGIAEVVHDTSQDSRYIEDDAFRNSEITVPITINDQVWGIIDCEHPDKGFFTDRHLKILQAVAAICAVKIDRISKEDELHLKEKDLLQKEKELIELKISSLRRQINPHFIFNSLNSLQYFITSDMKRDALKYFTNFTKLIRKYTIHVEQDHITLEEELEMIKLYLWLQGLRYGERLRYVVKCDESLLNTKTITFLLHMVVEDLLENMIVGNSGTGDIQIHIYHANESLIASFVLKVNENMATYRKGDYLKELLQYKDHIDALNNLKGYNIRLEEGEYLDRDYTQKTLEISIPLKNLS